MLNRNSAENAEALLRSGQYEAARSIFSGMIASGADNYSLRVNYAQCLKRQGLWHEAVAQFQHAFQLHRPAADSGESGRQQIMLNGRRLKAFYIQHLIEQLDYLKANNLVSNFAQDDRSRLERLRRFLNDCYGLHGEGPASAELYDPVANLVGGCVHFSPQDDAVIRINPAARMERIEIGVEGSPVYVVDDFLAPETLDALRRFLLESTIWYDARPERGYFGAHLHDGFACRLVEDVAQSVLDFCTSLIGSAVISQVWAFKYAPKAAGIDLHADQASWNVNMWVTDTKYNNNPTGGGMTIYGCSAPSEWKFEMYNASPGAVRDYLAQSGATLRHIPYRGNRAVVFDSRLFHKTEPVDFSPEYQGRRINMTVMVDKRN